MSKGSIENPSIAIQPSEGLIDFIKSLADPSIVLPENLLQVYQGFTSDTRERSIDRQPVPHPKLTIDDQKLLRTLNSEESTVDLANCLRDLALNVTAEVDYPNTSIEILNEKTSNCTNQTKCDNIYSKLTLNLNDLRWIHRYLIKQRHTNESTGYLHELLGGSKLVLPQNGLIERNPELEARCERLRREQEDRAYKAMTKNVDCSQSRELVETVSYQCE